MSYSFFPITGLIDELVAGGALVCPDAVRLDKQ
jgi:hypothetical protein